MHEPAALVFGKQDAKGFAVDKNVGDGVAVGQANRAAVVSRAAAGLLADGLDEGMDTLDVDVAVGAGVAFGGHG